ncbi:NUDIX hydrolase [Flaviflagellibacter deserti]|uniref:NUDIX domain-containing protein n=1 Tax=Flaviflagellibacter deserti TaxID=2267266 RepID=A0ABV9Z089_9HYPH
MKPIGTVLDWNPGLADAPRPAPHPSQRKPRDAATIILLDRSGPEPKILLGQRHPGLAFMPGVYVFPGGRVEASDGRAPAVGALPAHVERRLMTAIARPSVTRARAYALAAIRELAEETGLLLGEHSDVVPTAPDWKDFGENGIAPSLSDIWLVARSITPPGLPRRFDTRFFAADASRVIHMIDGLVHDDAELVDLKWVTIAETVDMPLHQITRVILSELDQRIHAGIDRDIPVPFLRPRNGVIVRDEI